MDTNAKVDTNRLVQINKFIYCMWVNIIGHRQLGTIIGHRKVDTIIGHRQVGTITGHIEVGTIIGHRQVGTYNRAQIGGHIFVLISHWAYIGGHLETIFLAEG